ncbi:hypothetical protein Taro_008672 [Colocasia esculenta]|uniref:Uncharacterized protein n=1 Tax=Colocasia esculenta TaxID=4460 RepID=A0A843TYV3_COLES|nr:hypothetical protein [Colocasia esculenta]
MEHSSTTPPEKAGTQCTTTNHYPYWVQVPTTMRYHHGNHNESHTHEPQPVAKHESERNDATTREQTTG